MTSSQSGVALGHYITARCCGNSPGFTVTCESEMRWLFSGRTEEPSEFKHATGHAHHWVQSFNATSEALSAILHPQKFDMP